MTSQFVVIECEKCKEVSQIRWPFHNVVKLYCEFCNKCDKKFSINREISRKLLMEIPPRELIRSKGDIPKALVHKLHGKELYFSLSFEKNEEFCWFHLQKEELKFPLLLLNYGVNIRGRHFAVTTGIVLLEEVESFLNEPDFAW